jgi:hypothetical protein
MGEVEVQLLSGKDNAHVPDALVGEWFGFRGFFRRSYPAFDIHVAISIQWNFESLPVSQRKDDLALFDLKIAQVQTIFLRRVFYEWMPAANKAKGLYPA